MAKPLSKILTLANQITFSRILMTPVIVFLLYYPSSRLLSLFAMLLFVIVSLTDILDGYLARRENAVTAIGKLLDPVADKVLICSTLIMLTYTQRVPAWLTIIIVVREVLVTGLRAVAAESGYIIQADVLGKLKTVLQNIALSLLILYYPYFSINPVPLGLAILYVAACMAILSALQYIYMYYQQFKDI